MNLKNTVALFLLIVFPLQSPAAKVDFVREVRPIFEKHCYDCHGSSKQKSGLRLDIKSAAFKGGDGYASIIVPGKSDDSPLVQFIRGDDKEMLMPPKGSRLSANEIATICERVGADAKEVERGLKTEQRIGPKAYLSPGGAFAGGTLARDINFLASVATENGLKVPILSSVNESNDEHKNWTKQRLLYKFSNLTGKTIAVWGLTYKPGTDTLRRSLAIELCDWLLEQGAKLHVHDPVVKSLPLEWEERVSKYRTPLDALNGAIALVVATEWPQYRDLSVMDVSLSDTGLFVVDPNRFLIQFIDAPGIEYAAVGTTKGLFQ